MCESYTYKPLQHIGNTSLKFNIMLQPFWLNPPTQKVDITHIKTTKVANLVEIFRTTEYDNS